MIGVETQFSRDFFSIGFAHFASLTYFLTLIFLDVIHEKIVVKNQDFFFCLQPKVSSYSRQILSDVNRQKTLVNPDNISCFAPKIINVRN